MRDLSLYPRDSKPGLFKNRSWRMKKGKDAVVANMIQILQFTFISSLLSIPFSLSTNAFGARRLGV